MPLTVKPHPAYFDKILIGGESIPTDEALRVCQQIADAVQRQTDREANARRRRVAAGMIAEFTEPACSVL